MQLLAQSNFWIIDNDADTRAILNMLLQKVIKSTNVALFEDSRFLEVLLDDSVFIPDIIFVDLMVRPLDGYTILQKLQQNRTFQAAKFIAVTAKVMPTDIRQMQQAGFHGLISKPIIRQVFPELVQRILANESVWYIA